MSVIFEPHRWYLLANDTQPPKFNCSIHTQVRTPRCTVSTQCDISTAKNVMLDNTYSTIHDKHIDICGK